MSKNHWNRLTVSWPCKTMLHLNMALYLITYYVVSLPISVFITPYISFLLYFHTNLCYTILIFLILNKEAFIMKNVLITGGNKGIGLETTALFLNNNYKVYVVARDFKDFKFKDNPNAEMIKFDVTDIQAIKGLVSALDDIHILINNAGIMNSLPYNQYPKEAMEKLMNVNLYAPIEFITQISQQMISRKSGRIVNTASVAGQIGHPDVWYGISKAGIINASKSFAKLLAPHGIVINSVAPGPVYTDMLDVIPEPRKEAIMSSVYTGRFCKAEEVAQTIYWLATDSPEYINGTCIDLNNGSFPR